MKIGLLGDIALIGKYDITNNNIEKHIKYLKELLGDCDYVIANLESPLTNKKKSLVCKSAHLKSNINNVKILKMLKINAVSLANNHIFDYGKGGVLDTIETLEKNEIEWYGVRNKSVIQNINGEKISLSGFCCYSTNGIGYSRNGINLLTKEKVLSQLKKDKEENAFSICSIHWGIEHTNYPAWEHINLAKEMMNINSAIIHGHHPHVIQGIINYKNSLTAFSLGNSIFDVIQSINDKFKINLNENNKKGMILKVNIENQKIVNYETIGIYLSDNGIIGYPIDEEIKQYSSVISNLTEENKNEYQNMRHEQYSYAINEKFGKHDIKWFLSRMNYYSIGAKIISKINSKKYKRIFRNK